MRAKTRAQKRPDFPIFSMKGRGRGFAMGVAAEEMRLAWRGEVFFFFPWLKEVASFTERAARGDSLGLQDETGSQSSCHCLWNESFGCEPGPGLRDAMHAGQNI